MKANFKRAVECFRAGDVPETIELCRQGLVDLPEDAKLRALLGTALIRQHDFAGAERELRQVVEAFPDFPKANRELGGALFGLGRGDEAVECFEQVVKLAPESSAAHFDLSSALSKVGREEDARAALESSFQLDPKRKNLLTAAQQHRAGKLKEAEMTYRAVLREDPKNVTATKMLGSLASDQGRTRLAKRLLSNATRLAPDFFPAWTELARILIENEEFEEAEQAVDQAAKLEPALPFPHLLRGNLLTKAGHYEEAVEAFNRALELQPDHGASLAGLGHALKTIGKQEQAIDSYRGCAKSIPAFGEAYWSLANLKTFRFDDDEIATMEKYVDDEALRAESRVNFNFALGKAYEDRGDYEQAFRRYDAGNKLRRPNENYDPVQTELIHDRIIETFSPEFLRACKDVGDPDPAPIFVVGLPRSGSTLLEQIFASHSQVEGTHELPDLARIIRTINQLRPDGNSYPEAVASFSAEQLSDLGAQYLESTRRHRTGLPYFTDKMPNNFACVGLIAAILPSAKIVNARRHPLDSCMGSYKQLFFKGQAFTYDLVELGEYYLEYQRLMDHWHAVLPDMVIDVHYEDVVADQEAQTRRLMDFCDLPWEDEVLRFYETERAVNTASSEQVRKPIYSSSIDSWRRFERDLIPLCEILEPLLLELPPEKRPESLKAAS